MSLVTGFRNGDDVGLPQHPGDSDLRRSGVVALGSFLERRVIQQPSTTADGRISHDRNLMLLAPGQEVELYLSMLEAVEDLIGAAAGTELATGRVRPNGGQLFHLFEIEV